MYDLGQKIPFVPYDTFTSYLAEKNLIIYYKISIYSIKNKVEQLQIFLKPCKQHCTKTTETTTKANGKKSCLPFLFLD